MESDFVYAVKAQAQPASALPLERLSPCVDRIERLTYLVNKFIERFYNGPSEESGIAACSPVPMGHNGQIERLSGAIDQLDTAVQSLQNIG